MWNFSQLSIERAVDFRTKFHTRFDFEFLLSDLDLMISIRNPAESGFAQWTLALVQSSWWWFWISTCLWSWLLSTCGLLDIWLSSGSSSRRSDRESLLEKSCSDFHSSFEIWSVHSQCFLMFPARTKSASPVLKAGWWPFWALLHHKLVRHSIRSSGGNTWYRSAFMK